LTLLRENFDKGPAYLAEKVFPAKSRGPINIRLMKEKLERATKRLASGKVIQKLDYDAIFAGYEEKFREAVENNRTGPANGYGKTVVWAGVAKMMKEFIPNVDAATCKD